MASDFILKDNITFTFEYELALDVVDCFQYIASYDFTFQAICKDSCRVSNTIKLAEWLTQVPNLGYIKSCTNVDEKKMTRHTTHIIPIVEVNKIKAYRLQKEKKHTLADFWCKKHTLADFEMTHFFAVYLSKLR